MKKLVLAFLLFTGGTCYAQHITGGIKAGVNFSNFSGGDFESVSKKSKVGFHGGGFLNIAFGSLSIQPEALISTQGAQIDSVNGSYDWKLTYINVPVMVKYRMAGGFYLEAGPQFGFKINDDIGNSTINDFANNLDLSIGAGLGFQSKGGLGIGARYMAGISKVGDFQGASNIDPDFKNSLIQLSLFLAL